MREIEIKARLHDMQAILANLKATGTKLAAPITQHDQVYGWQDAGGNFVHGRAWLRIRTETKASKTHSILTMKRSVHGGLSLDNIEYETEVSEEAQMHAIIKELGLVPYSDLTKTRRKAKVGDIEICVDEIEGLGIYIEAEKLMPDDADGKRVVEDLWQVLTELGVDRGGEVFEGYDVLLRRKQGLQP